MLPAHSQALLRAARSGALYKRPAPADDDDVDGDGLPGDKPEKKVSAMSQGFQVGIWKKVPRNAEGPSVSHLAKRHKGTITLPSKALATQITGPMITKATVRRIDAAGNPYTQEVTIADGQQVDGEIISTSVVPAPEQPAQTTPAAGTPGRRKPPLPQKKNRRGRGRGRGRGRMMLPTSTRPDPQTGAVPDGASEVKAEGTATAVSHCIPCEIMNASFSDNLRRASRSRPRIAKQFRMWKWWSHRYSMRREMKGRVTVMMMMRAMVTRAARQPRTRTKKWRTHPPCRRRCRVQQQMRPRRQTLTLQNP